MTALLWSILLLLLFLAGVIATIIGLRGRLVSEQPHCRRCRYDLSGFSIISADGARCPDCGGDLLLHRAVLPQLRRRKWTLLTLGLVAALASGTMMSVATYRWAQSFDWTRAKPSFMLSSHALDTASNQHSESLAELSRRAMNGKLGSGRHARLAERGVEVYEAGGLWDSGLRLAWGDIIEAAWERRCIDVELVQRYVESRMTTHLNHQNVLRSEQSIPVQFHLYLGQGGQNRPGLRLDVRLAEATIGNAPVWLADDQYTATPGWSPVNRWLSDGRRFTDYLTLRPAGQLPLGDQIFILEFTLVLSEAVRSRSDAAHDPEWGTVATWKRRFEHAVKIVPEAIPIENDDIAALVRESIRDVRATILLHPKILSGNPVCHIDLDSLPIAIVGDLVWRMNGVEWHVGAALAAPSEGLQTIEVREPGYQHPLPVSHFEFDMIIRPNHEHTRRFVDIGEYLGQEIVIRNVPVSIDHPD